MADYGDEWDKDDYGEDDQDLQSQESPDDIGDLSDNLEDIKGEEHSGSYSESEIQDSESEQSSEPDRHLDKEQFVELMNQEEPYPIPNKIRITNPYISKYQKALLIGKRADQISKNSPIYVQVDWNQPRLPGPIEIAQREYLEGKIPFIIRRYLPNGGFEDWKFEELKR